jgi:ribonuclease P protein component
MRFPRGRRITSRWIFQRVRQQGRSFRGHFLVLGLLYDPERVRTLKVGYITTRRIGNAVVRNRVRRRLRGILQRIGDDLKPGYFIVLVARNQAATASSERLEKEWKWLAHQANLFQETSETPET